MDNNNLYKAKVDDLFDFELNPEDLKSFDLVQEGQNQFHIIKNNKSYKAQIISSDFEKKTFTISVNGSEHQIKLEDKYDALIQKMGLNAVLGNKMNEVKAPMPGLVLDITVEVGQTIQKGDALLILEAMKMENVIKASGEGTIKNIISSKGDAVNKGDILIELE